VNTKEVWEHVRAVTGWLDAHSATVEGDPRILRCLKIAEEVGEVTAAIIGVTGQNPRKGTTHTWLDVREELCDVILSAMVALESVDYNAEEIFEHHVQKRHTRLLELNK
jgi:NTP pyrophosphatase (non-canonical NTP hydrolase)